MIVANGQTDVTTYFVLRDSTNHAPKTDIDVTDLDLYYCEQGAAMEAKVDATALAAADSAHADNKAFHVGQGLYRIDWPDEAFDAGVGKKVNLIVVCSGVDTTFLEVELSPPVNVNTIKTQAITCSAAVTVQPTVGLAAAKATQLEAAIGTAKVAASIAAGDIAENAIDAAAVKADAVTKIQDGVAKKADFPWGNQT